MNWHSTPFETRLEKALNRGSAEAASTYSLPIPTSYKLTSHDDSPTFSMDDFEGNMLLGVRRWN